MSRGLTKKQRGFIKEYVKTGNGLVAARNNYDVANDNVAANLASTNLIKPKVKKAIADMLSDDLLAERHLQLLNKREIKYSQDGDVISDEPETQAVSKGLEMAYKIKGTYAPEKSVNINIETEANDEIKKLTEQLNELHRKSN